MTTLDFGHDHPHIYITPEPPTVNFDRQETETGGSKRPTRVNLRALHPETGEEVGFLNYDVPRRKADRIYVNRLEIHPEHQGNGYASELMDEMQRQHPKTPIDHGYRTDAGKAWWDNYSREKSVQKGRTIAAIQPKSGPLSWDDIGELWPHVYGDSEIHGEAAEGADGPGIGQAANYLAHATPNDIDAENNSVYDLDFHRKMVHPKNIDYSPSGSNDYRVKRAKEGYQNNEDHMPPLVLVHRNGVYHVADGHHRAEAAASLNKPVRAYVARSPLKNQPFEDGEIGPFHGAEPTEEK